MDENTNNKRKQVLFYLKLTLIVIFITASAIWLVNNILDLKYKAEVFGRPCNVCMEFNKPQAECVQGCFRHIQGIDNNLNISLFNNTYISEK